MNGASLVYKLQRTLQESSSSGFLDDVTSYDYLYEAAKEFGRRTKALTASTTITSVAGQANYDLPTDFLCLYVTNTLNEYFLNYSETATSSYSLTWIPYERAVMNNASNSVQYPSSFSIIDKQTPETNLTGTASVLGAASNGLCTLTDTVAHQFVNVQAGGKVYNTTDGSGGIVASKTSTSAIVTALFNGTNNAWAGTDAYIVIPQNKKQIVIDAPPKDGTMTIIVPYIQRPIPVYSPYSSYRFDSGAEMALVYYAAWLYKYRDRDPNFGDAMYKHWDNMCRRSTFDTKRAINQVNWHFNLNKRSYGNRSVK
jgi:hypothetical protein